MWEPTTVTLVSRSPFLGGLVRSGQVQALPECRSPKKIWDVLT